MTEQGPKDSPRRLLQLLAIKRHEQPPPGYFHSFSDKVIARIEMEELTEYSSWWSWLINQFDAKPVVACLYGAVVSGLLLAGFKLSEEFERGIAAEPAVASPWLAVTPASPMLFSVGHGQSHDTETRSLVFTAGEPSLFGNDFIWQEHPAAVRPLGLVPWER